MCLLDIVPVESLTYLPPNMDKNKTTSKTQRSNAKNPFFSHKTKHICKSTWNRKLVDLCWAFFSKRVFVFRFRLTFFWLAVVIDVLVELHVWLIMNALDRWIF